MNKSKNNTNNDVKFLHRWILYGSAIVVVLVYFEFSFIHIFKPHDDEMIVLFESVSELSKFFLVIPFIAFMIFLLDKISDNINRRPILIRIAKNKIYAKRLDCELSHECRGNFSLQSEVVSDAGKFAETVSEAIKVCVKDNKLFTLKPYIVFTSSESLSKVQCQAAEVAIRHAGAIHVKYLAELLSEMDALEFVLQNPFKRFV